MIKLSEESVDPKSRLNRAWLTLFIWCFSVNRDPRTHRDKLAGIGTPTLEALRLGSTGSLYFRFRQNYFLNVSFLYEAFKVLCRSTLAEGQGELLRTSVGVVKGVGVYFGFERLFFPFCPVFISCVSVSEGLRGRILFWLEVVTASRPYPQSLASLQLSERSLEV
jgi:hypothetical protein